VFDVLRATSSMLAALSNGAEKIIPVSEIPEALALKSKHPDYLLAGERDGMRITADVSGGVEFDFGNSPREFLPERVKGRILVMTTTNGTRAIRACASARATLIGAFLNLRAVGSWIAANKPPRLLLVCSGTHDEAAMEDALAAGGLCERIWADYSSGHVADSAEIVRRLHMLFRADVRPAVHHSRNGRRLLGIRELRGDVDFCIRREGASLVAGLGPDGAIRRLDSGQGTAA
jgi:2-phosphosulfolactate phosphatase